jgi:hypothetical protein
LSVKKSEFIEWLERAQFSMTGAIYGETNTTRLTEESSTQVCLAFVSNTATALTPNRMPISIRYEEAITWPGTSTTRFGDYSHGKSANEITYTPSLPPVVDDDGEPLDDDEINALIKDLLQGLTDIDYDDLIPAIAHEDVEMLEETDDDYDEWEIEQDNAPSLRFVGKKIAAAGSSFSNSNSRYSGKTGVCHSLNLYKTRGGTYIAHREMHTQWQGCRNESEAAICKTLEEVIRFFGHDWLAKDLYAEADISDAIKVE